MSSRRSAKSPRTPRPPAWAKLPVDRLLEMRFCDLGLRLEGTSVQRRLDRLYAELESRGIHFRPHAWLSSEWFSPDGTPGIAVPFYLAHPRLIRLERRMMLTAEGAGVRECMRILRHETGHVLESAYRLHYRKRWQELFGLAGTPYPVWYHPRPHSRDHVVHLGMWYAQSHPSEDFAETFAVWLRPSSRWRTRYAGSGALKKLLYVDGLMREIAGTPPSVRSRAHIEPVNKLRQTLGEHYRARQACYGAKFPDFYDRELRRLFSDHQKYADNPTAGRFLKTLTPELRKFVAPTTGEYQYTLEQVLADMIQRCRELNLRLIRSPSRTKMDAMMLVTVQSMNYLHAGNHTVAM